MSTARTRLIEDVPAPVDEFGSHKRVADAIADMIQTEDGGKAIALEGSWGSGKSQVVELIRSRIPDRVFVFDAWAHDRGPLRRVFLENLIEFLDELVDQDFWSGRVLELRGRRKITETRITPHLTSLGAAFGLLTLILPVSAAVLAAALDRTKPDLILLIAGLLFCLAPAGLLVVASAAKYGAYLWKRFIRRDKNAKYKFVGLFLNHATHDQQSETIEDPEPTSIEFAEIFSDLLAEATRKSDSPLLIVVDNLDRVERERALAVWSALRVFIEECNRGHDWSPKTWLLVPFDRPAMENLWVRTQLNENLPRSEGTQRSPDATEPTSDLQAQTISESFLQKTFLVRFSVPPLLLADWREYLLKLLATAFPDHEETEFHPVYRVVAVWRDEIGPPTPRHLKLLVNDMGALYRQWPEAFTLADLAYFTVLRTEGRDVIRGLLAQDIPGARYKTVLSDSAPEVLAALHFNREIEQARHLLLSEPMKAAMLDSDGEELRRLSSIRGFWPVFEDISPRIAEDFSDARSASSAGTALMSSGLATAGDAIAYRGAIKEFCRLTTSQVVWEPFDLDVANGISAHMAVLDDIEESKRILEAVNHAVSSLEPEEEPAVRAAMEALLVVLDRIEELGHQAVLEHGIRLPKDVGTLIQACAHLGREGERSQRFWSRITSDADASAFIEAIVPKEDEAWEAHSAYTFDVLVDSKYRPRWIDFTDKAIAALTVADDSLPSATALALLDRLLHLARTRDPHRRKLLEFGKGGFLHHHYHRATQRDDRSEAAGIIAAILEIRKPDEAPGNAGESQNGHQELQQFLGDPTKDESSEAIYRSFRGLLGPHNGSHILSNIMDGGGGAFVRSLIAALSSEERIGYVFSADLVRERWSDLRDLLSGGSGPSFSDFIEAVARQEHLISSVYEDHFDPDEAGLLRALSESNLHEAQFRGWLRLGLRSVTRDQWTSALRDTGDLIYLLVAVKQVDADFTLEDPLLDALVEYGDKLAQGEFGPGDLSDDEWKLVERCLSPNDRRVLARKLLSHLRNVVIEGDRFFERFGEILGDPEVLAEDRQRLHEFLAPLVTDDNAEGIRWLADVIGGAGSLLTSFPTENVEDFKGRISTALGSDDLPTNTRDALVSLATATGVAIPEAEEADDEG